MKEHIEKIIEIVLKDVSCEHQEIEEHPRGPKIDDATYSLENEKAVIKKCIEAIPARLIERPEITVEFLRTKAREFHDKLWPGKICGDDCNRQMILRELLSSLFNELAAKINLLGKEEKDLE